MVWPCKFAKQFPQLANIYSYFPQESIIQFLKEIPPLQFSKPELVLKIPGVDTSCRNLLIK